MIAVSSVEFARSGHRRRSLLSTIAYYDFCSFFAFVFYVLLTNYFQYPFLLQFQIHITNGFKKFID